MSLGLHWMASSAFGTVAIPACLDQKMDYSGLQCCGLVLSYSRLLFQFQPLFLPGIQLGRFLEWSENTIKVIHHTLGFDPFCDHLLADLGNLSMDGVHSHLEAGAL